VTALGKPDKKSCARAVLGGRRPRGWAEFSREQTQNRTGETRRVRFRVCSRLEGDHEIGFVAALLNALGVGFVDLAHPGFGLFG